MDSLETFLKSLPKPGGFVRYVKKPTFHFFKAVIQNHDLLEIGKIYEVQKCYPASSWTPVILKDFGKDVWFDWGAFEKPEKPVDNTNNGDTVLNYE